MIKRVLLCMFAFISVQLTALFVAWIGGMQPFTPDAGFTAFTSIVTGAVLVGYTLDMTQCAN